MKKLFRLIGKALRNHRADPPPVDLESWSRVVNSSDPLTIDFYCVDCFTWDMLEFYLRAPGITLRADSLQPGFCELETMLETVWPNLADATSLLHERAFSTRRFLFIRADGNVSFEVAEPDARDD